MYNKNIIPEKNTFFILKLIYNYFKKNNYLYLNMPNTFPIFLSASSREVKK